MRTLPGTEPEDLLTDLSAHIRDLTMVYTLVDPIFSDDFESGGTTAWSAVVGEQ